MLVLLSFLSAGTAVAAAGDIGYPDQFFNGAGSSPPPTASKPESKLWWNDGFWWACMFDTVSQRFYIFKLNVLNQAWVDTGVAVDDRSLSRQDALWDGTYLYISSHIFSETPSTGNTSRLYRYSYDPAFDRYSLDAGFPVAINDYSSETLVIDKDSTGKLWATWAQGNRVWVNRTVGNDQTWGTPFVLPVSGTSLDPDDISSVIAFDGNKIGVMWSNQVASAMYFAVHQDGQPDTTWDASRTAVQGPSTADDHINLKSLQCDMTGRVYAAVKTSMSSASSPLLMLVVRDPVTGDWASYPFARVSDSMTRPIVVIDHEHGVIHMFATGPSPPATYGEGGGTIYEKTSPLGAISFPLGYGTPVMRDAASAVMNNATSTKQCVDSTTGLVVLAGNETTKRYWHAYETLAGGPTANFQGTPTSGSAALTVNFSDASSGTPTSWSWTFGDGGTSNVQNPSHTYQSAGTYSVVLTVNNASGSSTITRSNYIVVSGVAPTANFQGSPTSGTAPLTVNFTDTSTGGPTGWSWTFGDAGTSSLQNPSHAYQSPGSYTVSLAATNAYGSNTITRTGYINVSPAPVTLTFGPLADSYVTQGSQDTNYGTATELKVRNSGKNTSNSYLMFNVTGLTGPVVSAKLRLYVTRSGADGGGVYTTSSNWTETGITWRTAPSITGSALSSIGSVSSGTWVELALGTSIGANGTYSFALKTASSNDVRYSSREGGHPAQLVISQSPGGTTPTADFQGSPTSGTAPLTVSFMDTSTGAPTSWSWTFGDGGTSTVQGPSYTYQSSGTYTVSLTATNANGSNTLTRTGYISASGLTPTANFQGSPTSGTAPLTVSFTDTSTGAPTSWSWTFGDGGTSTLQSPSYTYQSSGAYTASLTATNANGSNTLTRTGYISVGAAPTANFQGSPTSGTAPLTVSFTDASAGAPASWSWTFGDGGTSSLQNPSHTYQGAGTYTVSLTATNAYGSNTLTRTDYIAVTGTGVTLTFNAVEDATVKDDYPNTNFGGETDLKVRIGRITYLKFAVSGLTRPVASAKLRLYVADPSSDGGSVFSVASTWTESTITWNNAPPLGGSALSSAGAVATGTFVELSLGSSVAGNAIYSFALKSDTSSDTVYYGSRETTHPPQLFVTQVP